MNCTRCNCEISDDAAFCPICGQKVEQAAAAIVCSGCGLQLERSARFCSVCGTPVGAAAENSGFAAPQQMNTVPQPVNSIPQPVNSIPQPAFGQTTDFNQRVDLTKPAADAIPGNTPAPQYDPMPQYNPANRYSSAPDYSYNPAAVAAAPAKGKGAKIAIIAAIAVVAVAAVCALVFVFNKGPVMNLLLGDAGYAAMLEGKTVDGIVTAASNEAVAAGIKSATESFSSAIKTSNENGAAEAAGDNSLESTNELTNQALSSIDLPALIKGMNSLMEAAYGTGGMAISVSPEVTLTDTTKNLILEGEDPAELDKALEIINSFSFTGSLNTSPDMLGVYGGLYDGMFTADAKILVSADGKAYLSFPFGSETALMVPIETTENSSADGEEQPCLELDPDEIKRLVNAVGDVYLEYYKNGEITVLDDGTLSAAGASAAGKLITVKLNSTQINEMFTKMGETIANDEYFCTKVVDFANACGDKYTAEEYRSDIMELFEVSAKEGDALVIETVVNKNNRVLAKSFSAIGSGENGSSLTVTVINGDETGAFEIIEDNITLASAIITKTDEHNGVVNLKVSLDEDSSPYSFKLVYSNVELKKFMKNDALTGEFTLSATPPADFTESVDSDTAEVYSAISQAVLTYNADTDGTVLTESLKLSVPQYGSIGFTCRINESNSVSLTIPADVIDLSDDELDEASSEKLAALVDALKAATDKAPDSFIAQTVSELISEGASSLEELTDMTGLGDMSGVIDIPDTDNSADNADDTVNGFIAQVYERIDELALLYNDFYEVLNGNNYDTYLSLGDELYEMLAAAEDGILTAAEIDAYCCRLNEIDEDIDTLRSSLEALSQDSGSANEWGDSGYYMEVIPLPDYNYTSMSFDEFYEAVYTLEDHYYSVVLSNYDKIYDDDTINALAEDCLSDFSELYDALDKLNTAVSEGKLDASLLRKAQKAAQKADDTVRKLDEALGI